ncbi:ABC transporter substrate-binding protein [Pseudonocardia saturnea]
MRTAILISVIPGMLAAVAIAIGYAIRQAKLPEVTERRKLRFQIRPVPRGQDRDPADTLGLATHIRRSGGPMLLAPPRSDLDRRGLLTRTAGLAALLGVAACGGGGTDAPPTSGATRTFEGAFGPVEVPVAPQRVISTDFYTPWALLDVGFTVVGTAQTSTGGVLPEYRPVYESLTKVGTTGEIDYEQVAALRPDLILGTLVPDLPGDLNERLSSISSTLLFEAAREPGTWQERAVRAADVIGRRAEAEALRAAYEQRAADIGTRYADVLGRTRWALVRGGPQGNAFVDLAASWSGVVLEAVGAQLGSFAAGKPGVFEPLSYEQIGVLDDCDVVLHLTDTSGRTDDNTARVLEQPTFQALRATREGRVYPLPNYYVSHYRQADAVLTEIERVLAGL